KPRLLNSLGLEPQSPGITGYLVNFDLTPQDLIQHYNITNLDIVSAGPIPPNPSELLLSPRIEEMINYYKSQYDIILIDSSPIGQVSDGFSLAKHVDAVTYMLRYNYTYKEQIQIINDLYNNKKMPNLMLVLND